MPTHYEVLGVDASASTEDVRRAYVRRARALHPDRQVGADPVRAARAARAMQDVNEAWRVLRNPAARSTYDRRLHASLAPPVPTGVPVDPPVRTAPDEPVARIVRGLPWVVVTAVLAAIFVFTAFAGGGDDGPSASDWVGKCVIGTTGSRLREVPCDTAHAERVDLAVTRASECPSGSSATPLDESWLCLRPARED